MNSVGSGSGQFPEAVKEEEKEDKGKEGENDESQVRGQRSHEEGLAADRFTSVRGVRSPSRHSPRHVAVVDGEMTGRMIRRREIGTPWHSSTAFCSASAGSLTSLSISSPSSHAAASCLLLTFDMLT